MGSTLYCIVRLKRNRKCFLNNDVAKPMIQVLHVLSDNLRKVLN